MAALRKEEPKQTKHLLRANYQAKLIENITVGPGGDEFNLIVCFFWMPIYTIYGRPMGLHISLTYLVLVVRNSK
jgi:hypothetical protein